MLESGTKRHVSLCNNLRNIEEYYMYPSFLGSARFLGPWGSFFPQYSLDGSMCPAPVYHQRCCSGMFLQCFVAPQVVHFKGTLCDPTHAAFVSSESAFEIK